MISRRVGAIAASLCITGIACIAGSAAERRSFSLEQVMSAPFPSELTASEHGAKVAWVVDERGPRNLWVAEGPNYKGRRLVTYPNDDGQEIAQIQWLPDASALVYVRGGDFETHGDNPNPASNPAGVEQAIWLAKLNGEAPKRIADGNSPAVSPHGNSIAFLRAGQVWTAALFSDEKPSQLIHAKGSASELRWSPDGGKLAFITNRGDHNLVGLYDFASKSLRYLDASVDRDGNPAWSPDGAQLAYIRTEASARGGRGGPVRSVENPWSIRVADVASGRGREIFRANLGAGSAFHPMVAENQLIWGAGGHIVFPWEKTGWEQLYSVPAAGGPAIALTSGEFEVEHVAAGPGSRDILFSANKDDIDRRHIWRVPVAGGAVTPVTRGEGLEWSPVPVGEDAFAYLHSGVRIPAQAALIREGKVTEISPDSVPAEFPLASLIEPKQVVLTASDGMPIHGQLFVPGDLKAGEHRPAMIFFHGGSRRQMLLGWHYMDYYNHAYAMNQYLASRGYLVLSVNYRSGIGYGLNFREALNYGASGASEFNDVLGAGLYMKSRPDVDAARIGLWGGSYGGYLTALGLARASDLFAVGVDFHGVHDWSARGNYDTAAARTAFESSPMASVSTWRSPVLLIHGDDDRNVQFHQTVMLVEALRRQKVEFEQLIFPDEIHGFLTHKRWLEAYNASARFIDRHLLSKNSSASGQF